MRRLSLVGGLLRHLLRRLLVPLVQAALLVLRILITLLIDILEIRLIDWRSRVLPRYDLRVVLPIAVGHRLLG